MPYKIVEYQKELVSDNGKFSLVALVSQEGNETSPFKVVVEHAESAESAKGDVQAWIDARVKEDEARLAEDQKNAESQKLDEVAASLNAEIQQANQTV